MSVITVSVSNEKTVTNKKKKNPNHCLSTLNLEKLEIIVYILYYESRYESVSVSAFCFRTMADKDILHQGIK